MQQGENRRKHGGEGPKLRLKWTGKVPYREAYAMMVINKCKDEGIAYEAGEG